MYTERQFQAIAIAPHVTGAVSAIASIVVAQDILRDRIKRTRTYCRLLLGACFYNAISSIFLGLATWPIPENPWTMYSKGNQATCTAQGFFIQLSLGIGFYYTALSLYFFLVLIYKWSDQRLRRFENYLHVVAFVVTFAAAFAGIPLELYNNSNLWCWIASYPPTCGETQSGDPDTCIRGRNAWIYRWIFFYVPMWLGGTLMTLLLLRITIYVWVEEKQSRRWRSSSEMYGGRKKRRSDKLSQLTTAVFWQSFYYYTGFAIVLFFPTVVRAKQTMGSPVPAWAIICMSAFTPSCGIWIFLTYFRPQYIKCSNRFWSQLFACCTGPEESEVLEAKISEARPTLPPTATSRTDDPAFSGSFRREMAVISEGEAEEIGELPLADTVDPAYQFLRVSRRNIGADLESTSAAEEENSNSADEEVPNIPRQGLGNNIPKANGTRVSFRVSTEDGEGKQLPEMSESKADILDPAHQYMEMSMRNLKT